jgi:hypothetical protein
MTTNAEKTQREAEQSTTDEHKWTRMKVKRLPREISTIHRANVGARQAAAFLQICVYPCPSVVKTKTPPPVWQWGLKNLYEQIKTRPPRRAAAVSQAAGSDLDNDSRGYPYRILEPGSNSIFSNEARGNHEPGPLRLFFPMMPMMMTQKPARRTR